MHISDGIFFKLQIEDRESAVKEFF